MRRKRAFKRGRALSIIVAAGVGYLIGNWNAAAVRSADRHIAPTAAEAVALRFPPDFRGVPVVQAAAYAQSSAGAGATMPGEAQLALFEPEPMIPHPAAPLATVQSADIAELPPVEGSSVPSGATEPPSPKPGLPHGITRPSAPAAGRSVDRSGFVLDDAQIASIRRRLHLTPDQEHMWPAVEAALRNLAVARERAARRRGSPNGLDPNSVEVADLKSAAMPLLMSFSDEQKDEVRSLAHVMGLDQLASGL
jgi:hypothetical protein